MPKRYILRSLLIIGAFSLAYFGNRIVINLFDLEFAQPWHRLLYVYAWWLFVPLLASGWLSGWRNVLKALGLTKKFWSGAAFGFATVLPMLLSSALAGTYSDSSLLSLLQSTVFAGFIEEFLFRGFLFGLLFKMARWGFVPAALTGAVLFGMGHLYQGASFSQTTGVFIVTAMGAVWFAWLYVEWNSLWIPIFLHVFMNLSWTLFDVSDNALGGVYVNIFRAITIALTILITINIHKKEGLKVRKQNLFVNDVGSGESLE